MRKKKKFNISLLAYVLCAIMIIIIIPCVSDISGDVFGVKEECRAMKKTVFIMIL